MASRTLAQVDNFLFTPVGCYPDPSPIIALFFYGLCSSTFFSRRLHVSQGCGALARDSYRCPPFPTKHTPPSQTFLRRLFISGEWLIPSQICSLLLLMQASEGLTFDNLSVSQPPPQRSCYPLGRPLFESRLFATVRGRSTPFSISLTLRERMSSSIRCKPSSHQI